MTRNLTAPETALAKAALDWLMQEARHRLCDHDFGPECLRDEAQTNFEIACLALERGGLLRREGEYHRVLRRSMDGGALPDGFDRAALDLVLCAVSWNDDFGLGRFDPDHVAPEGPLQARLCAALIACGYLERLAPDRCQWTDAFGPWRVASGDWTLGQYEPAPPEAVGAAVASMPDGVREGLRRQSCGPDFARHFFAYWDDEAWVEEARWPLWPHAGWDLALAAGIYAALHGEEAAAPLAPAACSSTCRASP